MNIDRSRHNVYKTNKDWNAEISATDSITSTSGLTTTSGSGSTIIISGGGSGLTSELLKKLNSIEEGAQVNLDAFSYIKLNDGAKDTLIEAAKTLDRADINFKGIGVNVDIESTEKLDTTDVASTGTSKGVYSFKYDVHLSSTEGELPKWLLEIVYKNGDRIKPSDITNIYLINDTTVVYNKPLTDSSITYTVNENSELETITILKDGLYFKLVQFVNESTGQPQYLVVCLFKVAIRRTPTITILSANEFWKLDENGNLYTTYNTYSTKELSAYGLGPGEEPIGALYLHELKDVDTTDILDQGLLQYNLSIGKWVVTDGSSIRPDLTGYATELWVNNTLGSYATKTYVSSEISKLVDSAPETLDTLYELAAALGNDPNFSTTVLNLIGTNTLNIETNRINIASNVNEINNLKYITSIFQNMFEWDKSESTTDSTKWKIKAKATFYSVGEVSAYGVGEGLQPTGAQYLYELKDVNGGSNTLPTSADTLLMWNGTTWEYVSKDLVGLNTTELEQYLTNNSYAKKSDITWNNLSNKPSWIGSSKPSYSWSEINDKPGWIGSTKPTYTYSEVGAAPLIHYHDWSDITTGKPTTLNGYGITDGVNAVTSSGSGNAITSLSLSGHTITYNLGATFLSSNTFDDLFEKVNIGTSSSPVYAIKAKYHLFSVGEITAYANDGLTLPTIWESIPLDPESLAWVNGVLTVIGGKGSASSILLNGVTYEANEETGVVTLPDLVTINTDLTINSSKTFTHPIKLSVNTGTPSLEGLSYYNGSTILGAIGAVHNGSTIQYMLLNPNGILNGIDGLIVGEELGFNGHTVFHSGNTTIPVVPDIDTYDERYVLKSGDTMTGSLYINSGDIGTTLKLFSTAGDTYIRMINKGVDIGGFGVSAEYGVYMYNNNSASRTYVNSDGELLHNDYTVLHEGNYSGVLDNRYLYWTRVSDIDANNLVKGDVPHIYEVSGGANMPSNSSWHQIMSWGTGDGNYHFQIANGYITDGLLAFRNKIAGTWGEWHTVLHNGNYAANLDSRYVLKAGDTMTGDLLFSAGKGIASSTGVLEVGRYSGTIYLQGNSLYYSPSNGTNYTVWHAGNDGSGSGLDADTLDGFHKGDIYGAVDHNNDLNNVITKSDGIAWIGYPYAGSESILNQPLGNNVTDARGVMTFYNYYPLQMSWRYNDASSFWMRTRYNGVWNSWCEVAFTNGNIASATRLQTPRTIWGQSFDGTGNISGWLSGATTIECSTGVRSRAICIETESDGTAGSRISEINCFTSPLYLQHATTNNIVMCNGGGRVGIGVTPDYKLHVGGDIKANSWSMALNFNVNDTNINLCSNNGHMELDSYGSELVVTGGTDMHVNMRAGIRGNIPTTWLFHAGSDSSYANIMAGYLFSYGLVQSISNGITSTFGAQNSSYCHMMTTAPSFYFEKQVTINGECLSYVDGGYGLGSRSMRWGDVHILGWYRTYADAGWYNEKHDGGIYMTDSSYVRVYKGKRFYTSSSYYDAISTEGGFTCYANRSYSWGNGFGTINQSIPNDRGQTPLIVAYRSGSSGATNGSNRLFSVECLNSGMEVDLLFGGDIQFLFSNSGNFLAKGEVTAFSTSDIRLKTNFKELRAIESLRNLTTYEYDWTDEALLLKADKTKHGYGLIALEVLKYIPEVVTNNMFSKGYLGIDYTKLVPFAISAIKEVDNEVTALKKRVKYLEDKLKLVYNQ